MNYQATSLSVASAQTVPGELETLESFSPIPETIQGNNESLIAQASREEPVVQNQWEILLVKRFLVKIKPPGGDLYGSGVIIAKEGTTYYVLTAEHTMPEKNKPYTLETHDGLEHPINPSQVSRALGRYRDGDLDLALLSFTSENPYSVARMANSSLLTELNSVYLSSWNPSAPRELEIITGSINNPPYLGRSISYALNKDAVGGTSGSPLLNSSRCVVGIHVAKPGTFGKIYLGIPSNSILVFLTFLNASSGDKNFPVSTSSLESCDNSNVSVESDNLLINVCKSYQSYNKQFSSQKEALQSLEEQIEPSILEEFAQKWRNSATNDGAIKLIDVCLSYGHQPESLVHQEPALQFLQSQLSQEIITEFIKKWFSLPARGTSSSPTQL
ncbi:MAG: trypsin-like peptidase domain-containing protein [Symploca sp. SIO1B1]|nr:trypsin-like peptidase domain-containing protein [Symploca sp. SIO1B1]